MCETGVHAKNICVVGNRTEEAIQNLGFMLIKTCFGFAAKGGDQVVCAR